MKELRGAPVAAAITEQCRCEIEALKKKNIVPKLAVVRVGAREDDLAYERGIIKRFAQAGAVAEVVELPESAEQAELERTVVRLNGDGDTHGILVFRPLPAGLDEESIKRLILPEKDIDGMSPVNAAAVFAGDGGGFVPCTPMAVMALLTFYGVELTGKKAVVVGRSMVVGKPLAMLLTAENATVTLCHTKTRRLEEECRHADILTVCAGRAKMIGADAVRPEQVVVDVGINMDGDTLCGDVDYDAVKAIAAAVTPVPGGVGAVTTSVLLQNTVRAAKQAAIR